jgi:glycosyltransferase involved in cell wall biosynthesis
MSLVSVVVPVFNNSGSLADLLDHLAQLADRNGADDFEFILVDDGSRDESYRVMERLAAQEHRLTLVKLSRNFGSNAAILAGLEHTAGDAVAVIAADLQDPPEMIDRMLAKWREGRKVVLAGRDTRDDPWLTCVMADVFYKLFRKFAIATMPPRGFDFFLIDRQVTDLVTATQERNAYLMGLILWLGFEPEVLYYHRAKREERYGVSMWTFARKVRYFADAFVAFSYAPIRAASCLGILFCLLGAIYSAYIVVVRIGWGMAVDGWASTMVMLLMGFGGQLLITGILGEYLWRSLDETRGRPRYICESVKPGRTERRSLRAG